MNHVVSTFGGFSVNNLSEAKQFYVDKLGLELADDRMGLSLKLPGGADLFIYEKPDHQPATFTVLNFVVDDIDATVDEMTSGGIQFDRYDLGNGAVPDDKNILRGREANMGPDIAWFKDLAGNVLSVLQN